MPTILQSVVRIAVVLALSVFWSTVTLMKLFWDWCHSKRGEAFFCPRPHSRPRVLDGWNHSYLQLSQIRMHYVEAGDRNKPLMVCLHGFPEFWYSYRFQLRHFSKDYHVVALDLRGYNETDKPNGVRNYDIELLAHDVAEAIELVGGRAILVGHDWGAAISWKLAMTRADLISRLVILNVPHPKAFARVMRTRYMFMFQCPLLPELVIRVRDYHFFDHLFRSPSSGLVHPENFTDDDLEAWKYVFSKPNAISPPLNYYRAAMRMAGLRNFSVEPIKVKTLIIWGEKDSALEVEGAEMSLKFCKNAKLVKIPDASHWVQQDVPEIVNELIEQFVRDSK